MTDPKVKNAANTRGRPFGLGNAGRPRGARNKRTVLIEQLMSNDAEAVAKVVIRAAKKGELGACKVVLDRVAPPRKGQLITFAMPAVTDAKSTLDAHAAVMRAIGTGELSIEEGEPICAMLVERIKLLESVELAARLDALELKAGLK